MLSPSAAGAQARIPPTPPQATASALKAWEQSNSVVGGVRSTTTTSDHLFAKDDVKMKAMYADKPWKSQPRYFNSVRMSAISVLKMAMHAKTGQGKKGLISSEANNWVEVMGLLQGHFYENTFVITDSFGIPVDASEVECAMNDASIQYMLAHLEYAGKSGRSEGCVGWYHSHPGLTCFLSGIDVNTQTNNQSVYDPWLAIVIDPVRTISTGKVEMRAFRTYPLNYTPDSSELGFDRSSIPMEKIEELGVHMHRYYELPITIFRSANDSIQLELLFTRYWMTALSTTPMVTNRGFSDSQLVNVAHKLGAAVASSPVIVGGQIRRRDTAQTGKQTQTKSTSDDAAAVVSSVTQQAIQAIVLQSVKESLFS